MSGFTSRRDWRNWLMGKKVVILVRSVADESRNDRF